MLEVTPFNADDVRGCFTKDYSKEVFEQNGIKRRCDTLVSDRYGNPLVIVEYKAPNVEITQKVFDQIVRYNFVLKAKYLIVSNGLSHYCCSINYDRGNYCFLKEIPVYSDL